MQLRSSSASAAWAGFGRLLWILSRRSRYQVQTSSWFSSNACRVARRRGLCLRQYPSRPRNVGSPLSAGDAGAGNDQHPRTDAAALDPSSQLRGLGLVPKGPAVPRGVEDALAPAQSAIRPLLVRTQPEAQRGIKHVDVGAKGGAIATGRARHTPYVHPVARCREWRRGGAEVMAEPVSVRGAHGGFGQLPGRHQPVQVDVEPEQGVEIVQGVAEVLHRPTPRPRAPSPGGRSRRGRGQCPHTCGRPRSGTGP